MIYPEECDLSLTEKQALPFGTKLAMTRYRIKEWYKHWRGNVFISNSGGRDSSVLAHIVMSIYPDIPNVFMNTGLEFPEIVRHVETFPNLVKLQPKMKFMAVIQKYGYPVISKETSQRITEYRNTKSDILRAYRAPGQPHGIPLKWGFMVDAPFKISDRCCNVMKKSPSKSYENKSNMKPILGVMAYESSLRMQSHQCNIINTKRPRSRPLSFWTHKDILEYIKQNNVAVSEVYSMGYERTGCVFCMFGVHLDPRNMNGINRFQLLKQTHPKLWTYCMDKLNIRMVMDFLNLPID